jgi:hypothetical protein
MSRNPRKFQCTSLKDQKFHQIIADASSTNTIQVACGQYRRSGTKLTEMPLKSRTAANESTMEKATDRYSNSVMVSAVLDFLKVSISAPERTLAN